MQEHNEHTRFIFRCSCTLIVYTELFNKCDNLYKCVYIEAVLMSSNFLVQASSTELFFRNANGEQLILQEKRSSNANNIINFALQNKKYLNISLCLTFFCATLFSWIVSGTSILFIISACILTLQYKSFLTSLKQGKL